MTVAEALAELRRTGTVESVSGKLKIHIPAPLGEVLQPAIETLRQGKAEAIALLAVGLPPEETEPTEEELSWASDVL